MVYCVCGTWETFNQQIDTTWETVWYVNESYMALRNADKFLIWVTAAKKEERFIYGFAVVFVVRSVKGEENSAS